MLSVSRARAPSWVARSSLMTASPAPGAGPDSPEPPFTPPLNAAAWAKSTSQTLARRPAVAPAPLRRGNDLLDRPKVLVDRLWPHELEGVPADQAADDDRRPQHRADHHQDRLAAP